MIVRAPQNTMFSEYKTQKQYYITGKLRKIEDFYQNNKAT